MSRSCPQFFFHSSAVFCRMKLKKTPKFSKLPPPLIALSPCSKNPKSQVMIFCALIQNIWPEFDCSVSICAEASQTPREAFRIWPSWGRASGQFSEISYQVTRLPQNNKPCKFVFIRPEVFAVR